MSVFIPNSVLELPLCSKGVRKNLGKCFQFCEMAWFFTDSNKNCQGMECHEWSCPLNTENLVEIFCSKKEHTKEQDMKHRLNKEQDMVHCFTGTNLMPQQTSILNLRASMHMGTLPQGTTGQKGVYSERSYINLAAL